MPQIIKIFGASPLNPLPFFQIKDIDFITNFPILDNQEFNTSLFPGVTPFPYSFNWLTNKVLPIQYMHKGTATVTLYNCLTGVTSSPAGVGTDITPTDFALDYTVRKLNLSFPAAGIYILYITIVDGSITEAYQSAPMEVVSSLPDCIKIEYCHPDNTFNFVFVDDDGVNVFSPTLFVEGDMSNVIIGNTLDTYEDDRGDTELLQATPTRGYKIPIGPIPKKYKEKLNMILSCEEIYFNDIRVQAKEIPDPDDFENNLGCMMTLQVQQKEWQYMDEGYYDVIEGLAYSDDYMFTPNDEDENIYVIS